MRYLILILALMFAVPAFAQESQTASQQLNAEIAKMDDAQKKEALNAIRAGESNTAARAREWIDIGNGLGEGLAATASKMGVVANEFATSPVGKLAMVLIVWNYIGEDITRVVAGFVLLFLIGFAYVYQMRKTYGQYTPEGKFVKYDVEAMTGNECVPAGFMSSIAVILTIICIIMIFV